MMTDALVRVVGWTLIHSLWQGAIVVAATAIVLARIPRGSARLRYGILCAALLTHLTAPIVTAVLMTPRVLSASGFGTGLTSQPLENVSADRIMPSTATAGSGAATATPTLGSRSLTARINELGGSAERYFPWLAMLWLVGVGVSGLRRVGGWFLLRRLIGRGVPATEPITSRVASLARTMGIQRAVQVLTSTDVTGPFTTGWLRPVIVLPLSMLSGLDPVHVDAIVAHELAHVRRWDYVVAIIQSIALTVLFHHPATWWLDRRLRIEREYCCDDLAVLASRDRVGYVRALAELESQRLGLPSLALAATDGSLQHRVARLLGVRAPLPLPAGFRWSRCSRSWLLPVRSMPRTSPMPSPSPLSKHRRRCSSRVASFATRIRQHHSQPDLRGRSIRQSAAMRVTRSSSAGRSAAQ